MLLPDEAAGLGIDLGQLPNHIARRFEAIGKGLIYLPHVEGFNTGTSTSSQTELLRKRYAEHRC
jgi:hypothetical protein